MKKIIFSFIILLTTQEIFAQLTQFYYPTRRDSINKAIQQQKNTPTENETKPETQIVSNQIDFYFNENATTYSRPEIAGYIKNLQNKKLQKIKIKAYANKNELLEVKDKKLIEYSKTANVQGINKTSAIKKSYIRLDAARGIVLYKELLDAGFKKENIQIECILSSEKTPSQVMYEEVLTSAENK